MTRHALVLFSVLCACATGGHCPTPPPCAAKPLAEPAPTYAAPRKSITLTYLGVAGWSLSDGASTMLFDPYLTRAAIPDMDAIVQPDLEQIARHSPERADVIAISHSHFDHALDAPSIARRTGAILLGTKSTANLGRATGLPERQIVTAQGGEELRLGAFQVRVVPALHSLVDLPNEPIDTVPALPLRARDYREGNTLQYFVRFAGHAVYFVGTANILEAELYEMRPDVAIVAVGLRHKVPDYTCRLLRALGLPARVLVNHFDEWKQPLTPGSVPLSAEAEADLAAFEAEVHTCAPGTRVEVPVHLQAIAL